MNSRRFIAPPLNDRSSYPVCRTVRKALKRVSRMSSRFAALGRHYPYADEHSDQSYDEIEGDRFADELRGEQTRGDGIDRHRVRNASRRCSFECEDPQDES